MYVCNCNGLNERAITAALMEGARSVGDVYRRNGCIARCGRCAVEIYERLRRAREREQQVFVAANTTGS